MRLKDAGKKIDKKVKYLKRGGGGGNPLEKIVRDMRSRLIKRVEGGKDHKGHNFQGYSEPTKAYKRSLGRDPGLVNLRDTNKMLESVTINSHRRYVDVYLSNRQEVGMKHQKGIGVPKREWFGYTKKSRKKAEKDYKVHIKKSLRK